MNRLAQKICSDILLHELIERQVERTPHAIALEFERESLTYAELNERANRVARELRTRGIGPDRLVAVCIERGPDLVVALLGVLKAGGAYVPLDPIYPRERLAHMLASASPDLLLTQRSLYSRIDTDGLPTLSMDEAPSWTGCHAPDNLQPIADAHNLAYVIFTSGSTGSPKGVMIEHASVVNFLISMRERPGLCALDTLLAVTTICFDIAGLEIYLPLICGAKLVLVSAQTTADANKLIDAIEHSGATVLQATPATWQLLIRGGWRGKGDLKALCGGEALNLGLSKQLRDRVSSVWNLYGPTETAVWSCVARVGEIHPDGSAESIGRPIANTSVYILDSRRKPVTAGELGEIYIGGAGVARGYWNQPELSAERFVCDPFAVRTPGRLYRTGDLGRWRADGNIEFLGRNDHQVKIRGYRIELGEIEARLMSHERVREVVVLAREDVPNEKRLVAYLIPERSVDADPPAVKSLREHVQAALPDYMVPSAFVMLERWPLTPNAKINRRALPAPDEVSLSARPYEAPQGEVESLVANLWSALLGVARVGRNDNFLELGGHSLLIVQLLQRLVAAGFIADVRDVLTTHSLQEFAQTLRPLGSPQFQTPAQRIPANCDAITSDMLPLIDLGVEHIAHIARAVPGGMRNIQDIYPLAPLQDGILFHHLAGEQSGGDAYVLPILMSCKSPEWLDRLITALQSSIDEQDVLRTAVLWECLPRPVQVVTRKAALSVERLTLAAGDDPRQALESRMLPDQQRIDLHTAPLLRLTVATSAQSGTLYVLLQIHHLIHDHESLELLLSEVLARADGRASSTILQNVYRSHVAQALAHAGSGEPEAFFRRKLGDVDEPTLPFGLADVYGDGTRLEQAREFIELSLAHRLRAHARQIGVTPAAIFHAAWALVVARTSGRDDVVFGTVMSGRLYGAPNVQSALGLFANTLPLRIRLCGHSAAELIHCVQGELVDLLAHTHVSPALARRCSATSATQPLFSALLNYVHGTLDLRAGSFGRAEGIEVLASQEWTNFPITLSVEDQGPGFSLTAQSDRSVSATRVLALMQEAVRSFVTALETGSEQPAIGLSILPALERSHVLATFNATLSDSIDDELIHELVELRAREFPDGIALICEDRRLTYRELSRQSNQIANVLIERGVGPEKRVGVYAERSMEMVVALLGILKAGGAYIPLDVALPTDRVATMIRESEPVMVLSDKRLIKKVPMADIPVLALDADLTPINDESSKCPDARARGLTSASLAYVIYTSGSTGTPKGVMIEHRHLANFVGWSRRAFLLGPGTRGSCVAAMGFDAAVWEIWGMLSVGGTLDIAPQQLSGDAEALLEWWVRRPLDVSFLPTPIAELALRRGVRNPQLRCLWVGGDRLRHRGELGECKLFNNYGPTECTIVATCGELLDHDDVLHIGRPIDNTRVYVLDAFGCPTPIGVTGEMHIGGAGVARGYLNRPDLTSQRFVDDPFNRATGARMYRTGDLACWRPDGTLEFFGRNDGQVKIRGNRIELGEIEACLLRCPWVREAAVIVHADKSGDQNLVAYFAASSAEVPDVTQLRTHLRALLPEYMVPQVFIGLERLPLTNNGKLDRRALPAPDPSARRADEDQLPIGETEEFIAKVWQEALELREVGRNSHFFQLGGHSLLATQVVVRIRAQFSIELRIPQLFEYPTLQELSARVDELRRARLLENLAGGGREMEELLAQITALSDQDAREMAKDISMEGQS